MNKRLEKVFCTCFGVGYLPAPGTCASALTCVALFFCGGVNIPFLLVFTYIALKGMQRYLSNFDGVHVDPPHVVIDEVVGQMYAFVGVRTTPSVLFWGFLLFRFFDIVKPGPVGVAERMKGAHGVLWDDVVAGVIVMLLFKVWYWYV